MARTQKNVADKSPSIEDVSAQIDKLKADIAELTATLGSVAEVKTGEARERATELGHAAEAQAMDGAATVAKAARENPAATLGIVAALGFAFGFLTARK